MNRRQFFLGASASLVAAPLLASQADAAAPECFYVHRNGATQALYTTQYNRIMFLAANMDDGSHFDFSQSRWVAPANGRVLLTGAAFCGGGLRLNNSSNWTMKFIRNSSAGIPPTAPNGADVFAIVGGPMWPIVLPGPWGANGFGLVTGNGLVAVTAGDAIEMAVYNVSESGGHTAVLDGNPAHTFMSGAFWAS